MPLTTVQSGMMDSVAQYYSFKNRIINGGMVIDQRNNGASITPVNTGQYLVDRWQYNGSLASKVTAQRNAGSVTPPAGFINYQGITSSSAYSVISSDYFQLFQPIEGLNVYDLGWGAAGAATVTLSFWVRSSLTGTFGGSIRNYNVDRSYPFSYTISSANTWEQKSVTIAGDTSGTWLTTNSVGIFLTFSLGAGSTFSGTANTWQAGNYVSATGATSVVGTSGATFYVTGVQLEKGVTATSFDYRPIGTELALCQRYYQRITRTSASLADVTGGFATGGAWTNAYQATISLPVTMRSAPSIDSTAATTFQFHIGGVTNGALNSISFNQSAVDGVRLTGGWTYAGTNGLSGQIAANNATAYIGFSSEL